MKENLVKITNLWKKYDNTEVIKDFNLNIQKGEFITLLGPSGCGKSTLLRMIAGFEDPTSGRILVNKIDIKDLPIQRRPTVTVFQDYSLFPHLTVYKNIKYGLHLIREPIKNVNNKIVVDINNFINIAKKKSDSKIKDILAKQNNLNKDYQKLKLSISKNSILNEVNLMEENDFDEKMESINQKFINKYNTDIKKSIPLKIKILEIFNYLLMNLNINKLINYKVDDSMIEIDGDDRIGKLNLIKYYLAYERAYRENYFIEKNIEKNRSLYNDLDYWISYWQNYPIEEKEWYERKKLSRKLTKLEEEIRIKDVIKLIGLVGNENKFPHELSGGMQQRVALARAIIIEPEILLLDEPLSALDAKVRKQMQIELKRLHKELGITFIFVTHDQEEALTLSDKIIVMNNGEIQQNGTPQEIYDKPKNEWVAGFIGAANILDGIIVDKSKVKVNNQIFQLDKTYDNIEIGKKVKFMIRPEDFDVVEEKNKMISVKLISTLYKGIMWESKCLWNDNIINVKSVNKIKHDGFTHLSFDVEDVHLMVDNNE
ncbi:MAG: ATP-binding cassette domain-containing protein [Mycoplasmoidaceae bacterium]